jgi:hypothetical protein
MRSNGGRRAVLARLEPYRAPESLANRLLCDALGRRARQAAAPWGASLPVVEIFGNRYAFSGDVQGGMLYALPFPRSSKGESHPVLRFADGGLFKWVSHYADLVGRAGETRIGSIEDLHYVDV